MQISQANETLSQLASLYNVNSNLIVKWKKLLLDNSAEVFASVNNHISESPPRPPSIMKIDVKYHQM